MEGTPFGRYQLIALLGRGGMGEVWRAHDTDTDRIVALKLMPPSLAHDANFSQRFRREAHAAARLNNPHIIPIHHYGEIDGHLYVDMRLVEGRDLQAVLEKGRIDPARAVRIVEQVAKALHAAHRIGLVHRDVKPSNILLDEDDFAYLIDFGIARALDETRITSTGNAIGTFLYMAPERLGAGGQDDARADVYALACVLYQCLTGNPPFAEPNVARLVAAHLNAPPPQPSADLPSIPTQLDTVIEKGLAKDPDQRYPTTIELAAAAKAAVTERKSAIRADAPTTRRPAMGDAHRQTGIKPDGEAPGATSQRAKKRPAVGTAEPGRRIEARREAVRLEPTGAGRQNKQQPDRLAGPNPKRNRSATLLLCAIAAMVLIAVAAGAIIKLQDGEKRTPILNPSVVPDTAATLAPEPAPSLPGGTYTYSANGGPAATWTIGDRACNPTCRVTVTSSTGWSTQFSHSVSDWWRSDTIKNPSEAAACLEGGWSEKDLYIYLNARTMDGGFKSNSNDDCDATFKLVEADW